MPPGVLTNMDRAALEITVRLLIEFRAGKFNIVSNLQRALGSLGMTPVDRAKISIQEKKPNGEWSDEA